MEETVETKTLVDLVKERIGEHEDCRVRSDVANSRRLALALELSLAYEALAPIVGQEPAPKPRRQLSAETRQKMAEAQKRLWAARRGNSGLGPIKDSLGNVVAEDFAQPAAAE